ncbi:alpha/beta hydrolase family protein [Kribbella deserti]|uniref:Alpha/beta hydrolase family protein n=1 Tax=Kribbella deserti TaxID=1926257 RepID=A0ABV6QCY4_9ACTN
MWRLRSLAAPTGPHRVGVTALHLVDSGRRDPWRPELPRELMTSMYYPARHVRDRPLAPQLSPGTVEWFERIDVALHSLPVANVDWAATRTHSYADAPAQPVRRPVLLYSPGGADPRAVGTTLAEDLASRGYVVVTIDHPGETSAVEFPGGRVRPYDVPGDPRTDPAMAYTMMTTRFADIRFVLDRLEDLAAGRLASAPPGLDRALDLRRIGMYGHSAGGGTAAQAMYADRRIDAAVNLEGYLDHLTGELFPIARKGTDRPLLLVGTDGFRDARFDRSWAAVLGHGGPVRRTEVVNANHWIFTDYASMAPQLQAAGLMSPAARSALVGPVEPCRSVPLIRRLVLAFFDRHLRR